jgi:hypothetical protein
MSGKSLPSSNLKSHRARRRGSSENHIRGESSADSASLERGLLPSTRKGDSGSGKGKFNGMAGRRRIGAALPSVFGGKFKKSTDFDFRVEVAEQLFLGSVAGGKNCYSILLEKLAELGWPWNREMAAVRNGEHDVMRLRRI